MRKVTPALAVPSLVVVLLVMGLPELRAQAIDWSSPAPRLEMRDFQQFLTSHPWIAQKLREKPSLANEQSFLNDNPELPQFLNAHPFVASSFKTDASSFMSRAQQGDVTSWTNPANYQELQDFQQFLSSHPWISGKLRQNPSLANDEDFLNGNHELPQFLSGHPYIQSNLKADPKRFMLRMQDSVIAPGVPAQGGWNSWDTAENRQAMVDFQNFLSSRTGLADTLQNDPSLANDQNFLSQQYDFRQFLNTHPYVRHALQSNATGFMLRMERLGTGSAALSGDDYAAEGNQQQQRQETQDWIQFMDDHPWIANKLRQNPTLANSRDFTDDNQPLVQFMNSHPYVQSQFRADPKGFMERAQAFAAGGFQQGAYDPHAPDYASLNQFMLNHPWIANQLKEKPSRATSNDFLNENKELRDFLQAHPYLQEQFKQDARRTIDRALQSAGQY